MYPTRSADEIVQMRDGELATLNDDADSSMSLCDFAVDLSQKQTQQTGLHHYFFVSFSPLTAVAQSGIDWR